MHCNNHIRKCFAVWGKRILHSNGFCITYSAAYQSIHFQLSKKLSKASRHQCANHRTDEYGGSIENRNRFVLEVMREMVNAIGSNKVGIKLSPTIPHNSIIHNAPIKQFARLIKVLDEMPLAYVHLMNSMYPLDKLPHYPKNVLETFGKLTRHTVIANGGFDSEKGEAELEKDNAAIISYGTLFLANPDLPKRFELNAELNQADRATMFGGGEKGYTDYPFL
jgi:N-ethylmaleimide reductase